MQNKILKIIKLVFPISLLFFGANIALAADTYSSITPQDFVGVNQTASFEFFVQGEKVLKNLKIESGTLPPGTRFDFLPGKPNCNASAANIIYCDVLKGIVAGVASKAGVYDFVVSAESITGEKSYGKYTISVLDNNPTYLNPVFPRTGEIFAYQRLLRFKWNSYNPQGKVGALNSPIYTLTIHKVQDNCANLATSCLDTTVSPYTVSSTIKEITDFPWVIPSDMPKEFKGKVRYKVALNGTDVSVFSPDFYIYEKDEFAPPTVILNNFNIGDSVVVGKTYDLSWTTYNLSAANAMVLDFMPLEGCGECNSTINIVDILELHRKSLTINKSFPYRGKGRFIVRTLTGNVFSITPVVEIVEKPAGLKLFELKSLADGSEDWAINSPQRLNVNLDGYPDGSVVGLYLIGPETGEGLVQFFDYKPNSLLEFRVPAYVIRDGKAIVMPAGSYKVKVKLFEKNPCVNACEKIDPTIKESVALDAKWPVFISKGGTSFQGVGYDDSTTKVVLGNKVSILVKVNGLAANDKVTADLPANIPGLTFTEFSSNTSGLRTFIIEGSPTVIASGVAVLKLNGNPLGQVPVTILDPKAIIKQESDNNVLIKSSYLKVKQTGQILRIFPNLMWLPVQKRAVIGNAEIPEMDQALLPYYTPVRYIRLKGTNPVYKVENGSRRLMTPVSKKRDGVTEVDVIMVTRAEFYGLKAAPTYR